MNTHITRDEPIECHTLPRDYRRVARAIAFLQAHAEEQPSLDALSASMGLSPSHAQRLFRRWAGVSPKQFVRAVTFSRARDLLQSQMSVLETAHVVGLSGPSRLHDLSVRFEAMTPGEISRRGAGLTLFYGFHATPFGHALLVVSKRGLCALGFADEAGGEEDALADMKGRWPAAHFVHEPARTKPIMRTIFETKTGPLTLNPLGTEFQIQVWQALLRIAPGRVVTYSALARHLNASSSVRAVASAVGRNPISYVIPCHRVLRKSGALGGYHWGLARKQAMLAFEAVHREVK